MQVSVEKVSRVERRLTIIVPAQQVEDAYTRQIMEFAKKANIKGFRPGRAPLSYIKQRFGADARKEAVNDVIQKSLYQAIVDEKLQPVSTPRVEPKVIAPDKPLEFVVSFEVLPEIEKINFEKASIEKLNVTLTDADIDRVLAQLLKQYTDWKLVDRPAQENDRVVIDYHTVFEGNADLEHKRENFPLELGSKLMLPGFEEGLIGSKVGDEKTIASKFPDDFTVKERAGKPVDFVVTVKQVFEANKPELTEDFVQKLGIASGKLEDLKNQVKQTLEHERDRLIKEKLKEQVFTKLLDQNQMEVPNALVAREAKVIHDEIYPHHKEDKEHSHNDEEIATFNDIAKKRVALGLLIAEYARKENLTPDKARVDDRIQEIASSYQNPQEVAAWLAKERRGGIEAQILEDQVLEKLMEGLDVTEKDISYDELKGTSV